MNEQDKQLLLKDLCARFSYGVRLHFNYMKNTIVEYATIEDITKLKNGDYSFHIFDRDINDNPLSSTYIKFGERFVRQYIPYLRPMSSMTEEEKSWYESLRNALTYQENGEYDLDDFNELNDFLNRRKLDRYGLIERGLALEAPKGMYEIK